MNNSLSPHQLNRANKALFKNSATMNVDMSKQKASRSKMARESLKTYNKGTIKINFKNVQDPNVDTYHSNMSTLYNVTQSNLIKKKLNNNSD